jgi:cytochrome P450
MQKDYDEAQYLTAVGSSHRACIGRNLARFELDKIVVSLLARYEMELVGEDEAEPRRMPKTKSFGVADLDESLLVRLQRRNISEG